MGEGLMKGVRTLVASLVCITVLGFGSARLEAGKIDFEGLAEGKVVDKVENGAGATGLQSGYVGIFGFNPVFGVLVNAAVIFDSSCPPGGTKLDCSGTDSDLGTPNETFGGPGHGVGGESGQQFENAVPLGNLVIVAEDLVDSDSDGLIDDPDDADEEDQFIELDFRSLKLKGNKGVTVNDFTYVDNDAGEFNAQIEFFGPGTLNPSTIGVTPVGDNGVNVIAPAIEGVTHMRFILDGSGGLEGVTLDEELVRACWVTTGGFDKGEVTRSDPSGQKICTFGGNVGPPPSGAFEVNWHDTGDPSLDGATFHTNEIVAVGCEDRSRSGPGQPGGKKGLVEDTLLFECEGRFNNQLGYTCSGFLLDGGEPAGKKGNDPDQIQLVVFDPTGTELARCEGILSGGNVQIHPPVGQP
jgi:hypothetical protein